MLCSIKGLCLLGVGVDSVVKFCIIEACMLVNLQREEGLRSTFLRTLLKPQMLCWELQAPMLMNFVLNVPGDVSVCVCVSRQCQFSCATPVESASVR